MQQTPAFTHVEHDAVFESHFQKAERARLAGRNKEAAEAYGAALEIRRTAILSGRLGLVLAKLGQIEKAAAELHDALMHGQGVAPLERQAVLAAYDKARAATTLVNVDISHMGAQVSCDGDPRNREGYSSFWMFLLPGEHTLRATLDGYHDVVQTFTAKAGDEMSVTLSLVPLAKAPEQPWKDVIALRNKRRFPPQLLGSNVATDPNYEPNEDPFYGEPKQPKPEKKKTGPRFSVSGGVVTVFGVASWNPAVGAVVGVGLRPNDYFSIGLEGRAAWLTTRVADRAINAMTAGGLLSLCGHVKWFFVCPVGHLGVIRTEGAESTFGNLSFTSVKPGIGGRFGVRFRPTERLSLQAAAEALALTSRKRIFVGNELIVDQPPAMIGTQITGTWEF